MLFRSTSSSLNVTGMSSAKTGSYVCRVTNVCGSKDSAAVVLTLNTTPVLTTPTSLTVCRTVSRNNPHNATFTVAATAVPSATYEWKKDGLTLSDGGKISGAQTASLTITGVTSDDVGTYSCTATNVCGSDTKSATLAVYDETKITTQPLTQTVCPGSNHPVTFTAAATGSGALSYQWQKNGGDINNATLSSYSIASPAEIGRAHV